MYYKFVIVDQNAWIYYDMVYQIISYLYQTGHTYDESIEIITEQKINNGINFENNETYNYTYIFLGTLYSKIKIPEKSIVVNFEPPHLIYHIITPEIANTCTIWDYSTINIERILSMNPTANCFLFEMGYIGKFDYNMKYDENDKDIDVLFLGIETSRRNNILDRLKKDGYKVAIENGKTDIVRAELIKRSKICLFIYAYESLITISSSRYTPILCNNGFIIGEKCEKKELNDKWSKFMITTDYDNIYEMTVMYLKDSTKREELADKFYKIFKRTQPTISEYKK